MQYYIHESKFITCQAGKPQPCRCLESASGGGLVTPWSARTVMSSVLFNVGPNPPLPPPCPHSVHSSCDKRRPSLTTVLSVSVYYYEHKKSKNEGRLGSNGAMISRGCLMKSSSVFPLVPFRLVVLSFPSCSLVRLLSLSWSSSLWWLNQEVCWEYTRGGEMTTNTKWYSTPNIAKCMFRIMHTYIRMLHVHSSYIGFTPARLVGFDTLWRLVMSTSGCVSCRKWGRSGCAGSLSEQ